ncbi:hypothetical protein JR316_0003674 [Psilocybe cubensis]|uniref:PHD-type domain-containing protein n=2 Tax=Psilocybe cubensis TaxID=181762 RepID=A0A8H7Y0T4_PSICU|nr:hypothetical protein JR316_0003674 [Psilocybe cubensis]KAH9484194.1 hypothetical protein JR316_0003674 [Psilocybe cubensis]
MATTASLPPYLLPGVAVHQPPHLEGDASFATEILPGPPSSASLQQSSLKRDPKKPSITYSYLPPSDPGSTYSGLSHGTLIGQGDLDGPRSKRSRIDKGATGRAQRASARNQAGNSTAPAMESSTSTDLGTNSIAQPIIIDSDSVNGGLDKEPSLSRSNSSVNLVDPPPPPPPAMRGRPKKKDKGKAKETDTPPLHVKEEPKPFSLLTPEPPSNLLNNEDHCSSCRSYGSLVYCDGCPRAFHFWCLDPPMENVDDDGEARWFCSTCVARKNPPRKPPPSLLSAAIHQLQTSNPVEFQLPEDIRTYFKDVGSGPKGNYVDTSEIKPPRLNRLGQLEERDPYRLRDRNGGPVLCFQCGFSALPTKLTTDAPPAKRPRRATSRGNPPDAWKSIVSCDYCNLHWHMDCLDPPLLTLPPLNKKWMCPNHAERVMPHKRRIPKQHAPPIEITRPRQFNNGNIEVIHPEYSSAPPKPNVNVDEVLINGRRYRVPERVIVLDFWNKLNKHNEHSNKEVDTVSGMSSPLTSLSSLDDSDDHLMSPNGQATSEVDESFAAKVLCDLSVARRFNHSHTRGTTVPAKKVIDCAIQTDTDPPKLPVVHPLPTEPVKKSAVKPPATNRSADATTTTNVKISALRRRRASHTNPPEASTRELRSRSRNNVDTPLTTVSSRSSVKHAEDSNNGAAATTSKTKPIKVKLEEEEPVSLMKPPLFDFLATSSNDVQKTQRVVRTPRQIKAKEVDATIKDTKEKRGRKRKVRDDELPIGVAMENGVEVNGTKEVGKGGKEDKQEKTEKAEKDSRKMIKTPVRHGQLHPANHVTTTPTSSSAQPHSPALSITPSLKIRLPRLSNLNLPNNPVNMSSTHLDTPTRR